LHNAHARLANALAMRLLCKSLAMNKMNLCVILVLFCSKLQFLATIKLTKVSIKAAKTLRQIKRIHAI
jgi:hypothetical protein